MSERKSKKKEAAASSALEQALKEEILALKQKNVHSIGIEDIANKLEASPEQIYSALDELRVKEKMRFRLTGSYSVPEHFQEQLLTPEKHKHNIIDPKIFTHSKFTFGATADTHMVSPHYAGNAATKTGPLWDFYRRCAGEGIQYVFHGGNWVDGHARFNQFEAKKIGITAQIEMLINEYPYQKGITTVLIGGDDHEGWWWQNSGIDISEYAALKAAQAGRDDMHFIGYIEADILLVPKKGPIYNRFSTGADDTFDFPVREKGKISIQHPDGSKTPIEDYAIMRLMHGGGGSSYAKSYRPQKIVSSYEDKEKPQILLIGHYHKMSKDLLRNTHVYQLGTTERQSSFMRKQNIKAELGNWIITAYQDPTGAIVSTQSEYIPYVERGMNFKLRPYNLHDGK